MASEKPKKKKKFPRKIKEPQKPQPPCVNRRRRCSSEKSKNPRNLGHSKLQTKEEEEVLLKNERTPESLAITNKKKKKFSRKMKET